MTMWHASVFLHVHQIVFFPPQITAKVYDRQTHQQTDDPLPVTIYIDDENDNAPTFTDPLQFTVLEQAKKGEQCDISLYLVWSKVWDDKLYNLYCCALRHRHSSGQGERYRQRPKGKPSRVDQILSRDWNRPVCHRPDYRGHHRCRPAQHAGQRGKHSSLVYKCKEASLLPHIPTYNIYLFIVFSLQTKEKHLVTVKLQDMAGRSDGLVTTGTATIILGDINDNPPTFTQTSVSDQPSQHVHLNLFYFNYKWLTDCFSFHFMF